MQLFGNKNEPASPTAEPAAEPTPDPAAERMAKLEDSVGQLAGSVNAFVQSQRTPTQQYVAPAPQAPIEDISNEQFTQALEEGGEAARNAVEIRERANAERADRRLQEAIGPLQTQGVGAINSLTAKLSFQDKEFYKSDPEVRKEVDASVAELSAQGLLNERALEYVYNNVVGKHMPRILEGQREQWSRQQREGIDAMPSTKTGRQVTRDQDSDRTSPYDLTPNADDLLQSRNKGRGQTADDFARALPARRVVDETGRTSRRHNESWDDMMKSYKQAETDHAVQQAKYFGEN